MATQHRARGRLPRADIKSPEFGTDI
ncbi:hypothetical protein FRAHR75_320042 [Frankia sp. Hr75.2]|nr:hypothetical protein FRAHR75_320042 [Frankia sp. Hr75.2]